MIQRIGIDATALPPNPVGAGNYIIQLVRAICRVGIEHELVIFAQRHGRELIAASDPGATWVDVPEMSPARRLIWEQTEFPRLAAREKIDLLHSLHYTHPLILPCASVVTFHDMTFFLYPELHTRSKRLFFPLAIRLSARLAEALIAVSDSTRRDAIRLLNIPPQKIHAVPSGINPEFQPITDAARLEAVRRKYRLPDAFVLFVGLIEPRKNIPLLLRAYARLVSEGTAPDLVLAGRLGWLAEDLGQLLQSLGIQERVHLPGYISPEDLPIVYNLARVFVYPSIYEGFGFPPLEAMACGTPVITSATSAMQDYVAEAGILTPPQDEAALTQALQSLLGDAALQHKLSIAGRLQAQKFSWQTTAEGTLRVYEYALAQKSRKGTARP
ncbi:MAG: glycosyltransferase family 4 protein [Anaerolineales bacterium]|nr:glycosyltransferase family 4 protein [Anaerolineales bacterium]